MCRGVLRRTFWIKHGQVQVVPMTFLEVDEDDEWDELAGPSWVEDVIAGEASAEHC